MKTVSSLCLLSLITLFSLTSPEPTPGDQPGNNDGAAQRSDQSSTQAVWTIQHGRDSSTFIVPTDVADKLAALLNLSKSGLQVRVGQVDNDPLREAVHVEGHENARRTIGQFIRVLNGTFDKRSPNEIAEIHRQRAVEQLKGQSNH